METELSVLAVMDVGTLRKRSTATDGGDGQGRVFCPHCDEYLAKRTYWLHKRLYYDASLDTWGKNGNTSVELDASFSEEDDTWLDERVITQSASISDNVSSRSLLVSLIFRS